ncbi:MAG: hypothetical protein HY802_04265 [Methanobacterium sp.]|nr:hypothetical protein [Methanobacterium sp.]
MKETPFAVVLIIFLVFLGVLYGVVLLEDNETSITEDTNALLNQFQSPSNQSANNMVQTNLNNTSDCSRKGRMVMIQLNGLPTSHGPMEGWV